MSMRDIEFVVILLLLTVLSTTAQLSKCVTAKDCESCMKASPTCSWCEDQNYGEDQDVTQPRCNEPNLLVNCTSIKTITSSVKITSEDSFGNTVQVKPQQLKLQLRQGQSRSFRIAVQPAENFPLDIYFLVDRSGSMNDDLETFINVTNDIATVIGNITTAYRFGFGIFTDKNAAPFRSIDKIYPCENQTEVDSGVCRPNVPFLHAFNFSSDIKGFSEALQIQKNTTAGDVDDAESSFEGLMQLSVCNERINWKPKGEGRRIVVIVTDALPKLAGDGKIGLLIKPNDGKCHLTSVQSSGKVEDYLMTTNMDYPSIKQLKDAMFVNSVTPLLAVTENVAAVYQRIAEQWKDLGSAVDVLSKDSSNIVQLLRDNYNRISTTVKLSDNSPSLLKFDYQVDRESCKTSDASNVCSNVKLNQPVYFDVTATLISCPTTKEAKEERVTINIAGFGDVVVDIEYLCECNCKNTLNSSFCYSAGTYECGICQCNPGRFGRNCKCDSSKPAQNDTSLCIDPTSPDEICNESGNCVCGKCECHEREFPKIISGNYCECKNFECPLFKDKECGGIARGFCECGKCKCTDNYEGSNCNRVTCAAVAEVHCTKDDKVCSNSASGECSCEDQRCNCKTGYSGYFCEKCIKRKCNCDIDTIRDCMECEINKINKTCDPKFKCFHHNYTETNDTLTDDVDCTITINECTYRINVTENPVKMNESLSILYQFISCKAPAAQVDDDSRVLALVLGIIGGILLVALLLLVLWKILISIHDKKEYAKFERSKNDSHWEKNVSPLYREPTQEFVNPSFTGNK